MKNSELGLLMLWAFAGCGDTVAQPVAKKPATQNEAPAASALKAADIKLLVGDAKALDALIEKQKGQVVFVDYWATWCGPCVEYFPHTVELSRKYKAQGLATITVSFDADDAPDVPRNFLAKHGADFENLICSHDLGPAAFEDFKIDQLPHFRLYGRDGKLRHKWDAKPDDVEDRIKELLAEKIGS